jgi:hypothetical protein
MDMILELRSEFINLGRVESRGVLNNYFVTSYDHVGTRRSEHKCITRQDALYWHEWECNRIVHMTFIVEQTKTGEKNDTEEIQHQRTD